MLILAINIFKFYSDNENHIIFLAIFTILLINKMKKGSQFKFLSLLTIFIPYTINQIQGVN